MTFFGRIREPFLNLSESRGQRKVNTSQSNVNGVSLETEPWGGSVFKD